MDYSLFLHETLKFTDKIFFHLVDFDCLKRFDWLYQVYIYYKDGDISTAEAIAAARWVLDNLCYANA